MNQEPMTESVLDYGFVRLVDSMGDDLSIVRAARVSFNAVWRSGEDQGSDVSLIRYLARNRHTSPFEAVVLTFEIKCPIFVARQWMRHRTWSYNEVSARYTELPEEVYIPDADYIGVQSRDNKQARDLDRNPWAECACEEMYRHAVYAFKLYRDMLEKGIPRELARSVLPLGTYTRFFATVDLHNLLHFIRLRDHAHAQYEAQVYARALKVLAERVAPVSVQAFCEYKQATPDGSIEPPAVRSSD